MIKIQILSRKQFCKALERILSNREEAIVKIKLVEQEESRDEQSNSTRTIETKSLLD